jgi:putative DNA primase/helicase
MNKEQILDRLSYENFYRTEFGDALGKPRGDEIQALCPFHEDHSPSLSVNLKTGLYNCFACGAKGDVFQFYQNRHGVDFKEALKALAQQAGVDESPGRPAGFINLALPEFVLAKRLPEEFLKQHGVAQYRFPDGTISTDFHYKNEQGKVAGIRHRFGNQGDMKFRWRKGDKVQLYGLWKLEKIKAAGWCLLVEGETDTLTCWFHGLPALGLPGKKTWKRCRTALGAKRLRDLADLEVYIWQEPDAQELPGEVANDLPDLLVIQAPPEFKDLSEAHCLGHDIPALVEQLKSQAVKPQPPCTPLLISSAYNLSDLGNARRLVAQHGQDLRHCHLSGKWFWWTGKYWREDSTGEVMARAKMAVASIYREAGEGATPDERKNLAQHALRSESNSRIIGMVSLAKSESGIPVDPAEMDANPWLLNCQNGTIDLLTGELREHRRADLLTRIAATNYEPDAPCDLWERIVFKILSDNIDVYEFVQRALGYALSGSTREQVLFLLWGNGANGKSTVLNLVKRILGTYARQTPTETLLYKSAPTLNNDIARLDGPRFVTAFESDSGRRLAESLVKQLTGGDSVAARFLYGEYFDFIPQFKLFLSTNSKPVIRGADNGIWRRIKMIPFAVKIPDQEQDQDLPEKLWTEAPGILAWLVRGCLSWQDHGLVVPDEVKAATEDYRKEMDVLGDFLTESCILAPGATATAGDLYSAYCTWAEGQGMREREQLKQRSFGMCLSDRGFTKGRGTGGRSKWVGVGLKE